MEKKKQCGKLSKWKLVSIFSEIRLCIHLLALEQNDVEYFLLGIKSNEMAQYKVPTDIVEDPHSQELKQFFADMKKGEITQ